MKIVILGTGKMGSWFARVLSNAHELAVYDRIPQRAETLPSTTVLASANDIAQFAPDLLLNAVDLQNTVAAFEAVEPLLPAECMLCDITSIKAAVAAYYARSKRRFVSIHPMFGPTFADLDALREENAILIRESDPEGSALFLRLFASLGLRLFEVSFEEHDQLMAYSLATPFVASLVFAACLDRTTVPGSTFARHMKVARGLLSEDHHLLSEVLFQPQALEQIDRITDRLEFLKHIIRARDDEEMAAFLQRLRDNLG